MNVLNLPSLHQQPGLSGLGAQAGVQLAVANFHFTQGEINTKCLWLIINSSQIISFLMGVVLYSSLWLSEWLNTGNITKGNQLQSENSPPSPNEAPSFVCVNKGTAHPSASHCIFSTSWFWCLTTCHNYLLTRLNFVDASCEKLQTSASLCLRHSLSVDSNSSAFVFASHISTKGVAYRMTTAKLNSQFCLRFIILVHVAACVCFLLSLFYSIAIHLNKIK